MAPLLFQAREARAGKVPTIARHKPEGNADSHFRRWHRYVYIYVCVLLYSFLVVWTSAVDLDDCTLL